LAKGLLVSDVDLDKAVSKVTETLTRHTSVEWEPSETACNLIQSLKDDENGSIASLLSKEHMRLPVSWTLKESHDETGISNACT
jgi:hypothetical protein